MSMFLPNQSVHLQASQSLHAYPAYASLDCSPVILFNHADSKHGLHPEQQHSENTNWYSEDAGDCMTGLWYRLHSNYAPPGLGPDCPDDLQVWQ